MEPYLEVLVLKHMGLARSIAYGIYRQATHALELDELVSVAYSGLVDAGNRWEAYCAKNGYDDQATQFFTPYCKHRADGAVRDYIRAKDWATRSLREKSKKIRDAGQVEGATPEELAERTGMTLREVNATLSAMSKPPVSLDSILIGGEGEISQASPRNSSEGVQLELRDESSDVEALFAVNSLLQVFVTAVRSLSEEQQVIVALHYYSGIELKKIAKVLDLTEAKTSQLHVEATSHVLAILKAEALGLLPDGEQ